MPQDDVVKRDAPAIVSIRCGRADAPKRTREKCLLQRSIVIALVEVRSQLVTLEVREDVFHDETVLLRTLQAWSYPPFSSWSSDGRRITYSYSKMADQPGAIRLLDLASNRFTDFEKLADTLTYEIRCLPDDRWLMLVYSQKAGESAPSQISALSIRDGKLRPITRDTSNYSTLTLSADGKTAATVQSKTLEFLDLLPSEGLSNPQSTALPGKTIENVDSFDWAPDGQLLISDGSALSRGGTDGTGRNELSSDSGDSWCRPVFHRLCIGELGKSRGEPRQFHLENQFRRVDPSAPWRRRA
jgi:hypothetical protein